MAQDEDPSGLNTFRAIYGNTNGVHALDALGNSVSSAGNISRDGSVIVGLIGNQAAFWSGPNYTPTLVTLDGLAIPGTALAADGGFVVGVSNNKGWICSIDNGRASYLEDWLRAHFGTSLQHPITSVNDILVESGRILLALQGSGILVDVRMPPILNMAPPEKGTVKFRFYAESGHQYQIEMKVSFNTLEWSQFGDSITGNGSFLDITLQENGPSAFFRLVAR